MWRTSSRNPKPGLRHALRVNEPPVYCANCSAPLSGPYCSQCGQEHFHREPTLKQVLSDAWEELVKVDGRIIATLRLLFTAPGKLTLAFFEGRRIRYVTPIKLYLTCSAAYFLVANFNELEIRIQRNGMKATAADITEAQGKLVYEVIKEGSTFFFEHLSTFYIIIVPITALSTAFLFRGRKRSLLFHLVFVLNVWSALFLISAAISLLHIQLNFFSMFLLTSFVYMIFAARGAFQAKWGEAVAKAFLFSFSTFMLSLLTITGVMIGIVVEKKSQGYHLTGKQDAPVSQPLDQKKVGDTAPKPSPGPL